MSRNCTRCEHLNSDDAKYCLNCGAMVEIEAAAGDDPLIGKVLLDRYRINRVLGEGGMGRVYMAEQKMGTAVRKVAIKTLHRELSGDPQLVARFHRECETVIELHHPNTVQFYDFGELEDHTLFIVMELIVGQDLAHVLESGTIDPVRADRLLIQICGSLHEAHQMGIVHRDLKPENILLTERGGQEDFVKVLDFGIAKRNEAEDSASAKLTKQGMVLGTPPYMSPEQFAGQPLDSRSDIYSLGILTYEMLTGELPFTAATPWEWATKHLTAEPKPIEQTAAGAALPEHKRHAIMRALAKDREARFGGVLEFMHAFTGIQDAQAAWTMATSAGLSSGAFSRAAEPRSMANTEPVRQVSEPKLGASPASGSYGAMPIASPTPMPVQDNATKLLKFFIVAAVGAVLLTFSGAAGIWWWAHRGPETHEHNMLGNNPSGTAGVMTPTTPSTAPSTTNTTVTPTPEPEPTAPEPTPVAPEPEPAATPEPTPEPERTPSTMRATSSGPSDAELATARSALATADAAIDRGDVAAAIRSINTATQAVGRQHTLVRRTVTALGRRGSNMVGILLQQGKCAEAQQLYRQLRTVGASSGSSRFFSPDWCARP